MRTLFLFAILSSLAICDFMERVALVSGASVSHVIPTPGRSRARPRSGHVVCGLKESHAAAQLASGRVGSVRIGSARLGSARSSGRVLRAWSARSVSGTTAGLQHRGKINYRPSLLSLAHPVSHIALSLFIPTPPLPRFISSHFAWCRLILLFSMFVLTKFHVGIVLCFFFILGEEDLK